MFFFIRKESSSYFQFDQNCHRKNNCLRTLHVGSLECVLSEGKQYIYNSVRINFAVNILNATWEETFTFSWVLWHMSVCSLHIGWDCFPYFQCMNVKLETFFITKVDSIVFNQSCINYNICAQPESSLWRRWASVVCLSFCFPVIIHTHIHKCKPR